MRIPGFIAGCVLLLGLTGCAEFRELTTPADKDLVSGSASLLVSNKDNAFFGASSKQFEQIDLDVLLREYKLKTDQLTSTTDSLTIYHRNAMQDRIIAASKQRCGYYLRMIVSARSQNQTIFGDVSTLLAGAAAVVSPTSLAKALAAGSSISTGFLTNYESSNFQNLSATVISGGINRQRQAILTRIYKDRQTSLTDYSVEHAISDAIEFHSACNIITGLEVAAAATKGSNDRDLVGDTLQLRQGRVAADTTPSFNKVNETLALLDTSITEAATQAAGMNLRALVITGWNDSRQACVTRIALISEHKSDFTSVDGMMTEITTAMDEVSSELKQAAAPAIAKAVASNEVEANVQLPKVDALRTLCKKPLS